MRFSIFLLFSFSITSISAQETSSVREVVTDFIKKSGGVEEWKNLRFFSSSFSETRENDSTIIENFSDWYRLEQTCYLKHSKSVTYRSTPTSSHNKKNGEEWRTMQVITDLFGISFKIKYEDICHALKLTMELDSLEKLYTLSDKDFGEDYFVIEKEHPHEELFGRVREKGVTYFGFSKNDGLLRFELLFRGDAIVRVSEFEKYEEFNGYLFPTVQRKASTKTKILKDSRYAHQFRNEINKIVQPKIITYQKVQFNQPIDEFVFEMN